MAITHHDTDIITYQPDGNVIIDTDGWHTKTTKDRLNNHLPWGSRVYQKDSIWYLWQGCGACWSPYQANHEQDKHLVFADGIKILPDRTIQGAGPPADKLKKLNKAITKYTRDYISALFAGKVPKPSSGDCWFCLLKSQNGETMGEAFRDQDHLLSHFEEKYYVPSLLVRAIELYPTSRYAMWGLGYLWGELEHGKTCVDDLTKRQLRSSLRRYLRRQLGLAS